MLAAVSHSLLDEWIDRDLSAAVAAGELPPAFEVDAIVQQAEELLAGRSRRSPVLVGPAGVGKTAVVHELVRRAHEGKGAAVLRDCRVVQISLRGISARFTDRGKAAAKFADLCDAMVAARPPIVPFLRDVHLAYALDWEPTLYRLLDRLPHGALCEALPNELETLFEYWSDLDEVLGPIPVAEPSMETLGRIVDQWCAWREAAGDRPVLAEGRRQAIELTARFMGDRPFPRKVVELLSQTLDLGGRDGAPVGASEIIRRFGQLTRVPERLVDPQVALDLAEVRGFVADRLLGQDEAIDSVVRMIALIKAGLADLRRPFGAFLFVGPTGVGKTHCAQLLAEYLFGDRNRLIRVNMADYPDADGAGTLFGLPFANQPRTQRGELAHRLKGHPFGVLLLDEFEKAHSSVHDRFLQLLDEGRYLNGRGEAVSLTSLIIVATSNAGAEVFRSAGLGFESQRDGRELDREVDRKLARTFRFELINRFDRVVHFHPLERQHIRAIALRELQELAVRQGLRVRDLALEVDTDVVDWLVSHGYHPHYGARFLRREIERSVAGSLAEFVVRERPPSGSRVGLGVRRDRLVVRLVARADDREVLALPDGARRLSRGELIEEASTWLARYDQLEAQHQLLVDQASRLIETSAGRGFWDDPERAQDVLRRYKAIDARLQVERRLLRPVQRLRQAIVAAEDSMSVSLGELVAEVAASYGRWMDLGASEAPDGVWLMLGPADPRGCSSEFLVDLLAMYRGWLRKRGYTYEVVAEEVQGGEVTRLVLEVEGPGALALLEMEVGEHRRRAPDRGVDRARVWVVPRSDPRRTRDVPGGVLSEAKRGRGIVVARRVARLDLTSPQRGLSISFHGASRDTLELLGRDIGGLLAAPEGTPEVAREYGLVGGSVRDPRTSASVASLKEALRGELDPLLRAWEAQ